MPPRFTTLLAAGWLAFTTGCAGSYNLIRPKSINSYTPSNSTGPVRLDYQFDALRLRHGNKKYVKKENKYGYHVVAVKVTNTWDREVNFTRDLNLLYGERSIAIVPSDVAAHDLRQGVAIYLLYLLLNVQVGGSTDPRTGQTTGGTFLPTGPFIAGGNMLGASGANANLRKEFAAYDLTNRIIKPGETIYGILSLRETAVAPIRLEPRAGMVQPGLPTPAPAGALPPPADPAPMATPVPR